MLPSVESIHWTGAAAATAQPSERDDDGGGSVGPLEGEAYSYEDTVSLRPVGGKVVCERPGAVITYTGYRTAEESRRIAMVGILIRGPYVRCQA